VYKLDKNWQTRAWHPVFKTVGSAPDAAMIHGLFSQKILKNLVVVFIRKNCIRMVFCLFCKKNFYPALFTLLYFIISVVATSF
jgi:hypothetical protein